MTATSVNELDHAKSISLGRVGLKMFFRLADIWNLNQNEQLQLLGLSSRTTLAKWKWKVDANEDIKLGADTI